MIKTDKKAVVYCRVSSNAQVKKGDGIQSQETRCREYARHKGYRVVEVFKDEGISGGVVNRPGMLDMLRFIKRLKHDNVVVIIDDISRLARGLQAHLELRTAINDAGAKLESPSIEFGEDSDSLLVENLLASVSQHSRQKNAEQVKNRMRSRMMNGYWVFQPPVGYKYERASGHGKMLVRDEPVASIVKEALESFASGRYETQSEVMRFVESCPAFPKNFQGKVRFQNVHDILKRVLYAGYIDHPEWNIHLTPAKHQALVSLETWQKVQARLKAQAKAPVHKSINADFPLRGYLVCDACQHPMTACWAKGRNGRYPYYLCQGKGCPDRRKSIRKEKIDAEFAQIVMKLKPSPHIFEMAKHMLRDIWNNQQEGREREREAMRKELAAAERKIEQFLDRLAEADDPMMAQAYENQVRKLSGQKAALAEKLASFASRRVDFEEVYQTGFSILENPQKLWASEKLEERRTLLKIAFDRHLSYRRNEGFQTASKSLPFLLLEGLESGNRDMVEAGYTESNRPNAQPLDIMQALEQLEKWADLVKAHDLGLLEKAA
jgi:site-specific DNA recombinase